MAKIAPTLPKDIIMEVAFDSGIFIEGAVHEVYMTIFLTIALVIFVIWIFLGDLRATIIPSVAIPVSLIGSFIVLWAFGFSMNLLTLLALVLAIGLVVDDAIVVLENVYKRIEDGKPPLASSFIGVNQVAFAVVATTLVLVAVFLPVSLMPGSTGKLFTEFAWADHSEPAADQCWLVMFKNKAGSFGNRRTPALVDIVPLRVNRVASQVRQAVATRAVLFQQFRNEGISGRVPLADVP